ncbi:MAG: hypothetical protein ABEJ83_01005, partial [Candidatus Nanohaloarchaea archaeon]
DRPSLHRRILHRIRPGDAKVKDIEQFYERRPGTCLYCGKEFENDTEGLDAETKELIHRSRAHVNEKDMTERKHDRTKNRNVVDEWRAEA